MDRNKNHQKTGGRTKNMRAKPKQAILAMKLRAMGDTILWTGTLRLLKERFPLWELHVMCPDAYAPLIRNLGFIDRIISPPKTKKVSAQSFGIFSGIARALQKLRGAFQWINLAKDLKRTQYSAVLGFHGTPWLGVWAQLVKGKKSLAIVNDHDLYRMKWWRYFSDRVVPGRGIVKANIDRDLDVLRAMGEDVQLTQAMPQLIVPLQEIKHARDVLGRHKQQDLSLDEAQASPHRFIFFGMGASRTTKQWPLEYYEDLAQRLSSNQNITIVACVSSGDGPWVAEVVQKWRTEKNKRKIFLDASLLTVRAILSQCDYFVGNDSGLKHMAVALGVPTLTFFGPESPLEWHPYAKENHPVLYIEDMPCRYQKGKHWCSVEICTKNTSFGHQCLRKIAVQDVYQFLRKQSILGLKDYEN